MQSFSNVPVHFEVPKAYRWIVDHRIIGYDWDSAVEPWHLLSNEGCRLLSETWSSGPGISPLVTFAKRQDNDDYACFEIFAGKVAQIVVIHGWSMSGYDINHCFPSIWEWLEFVIDEVREWQELQDSAE